MRLSFLTTGILLCLSITTAHAQFSSSSDYLRRSQRQRKQYLKSFAAAKAAGRDLNFYLRSELALGYAMGNGYLRLHRHFEDEGAHYLFDSTFNAVLKPKYVIIINECTGYPLLNAGEGAALILTYGLSGTISKYDMGSVQMGNYTTNITFSNLNIGVPVGLDLKLGGEAKLDKSKRFCLTVGAGFEPNWISGDMSAQSTYDHLAILPFAKAEIGFLTGFGGFKLRGTYMGGRYNHFYGEGLPNGFDAKFSSDGQFVVSLVVLEMLKHWDD